MEIGCHSCWFSIDLLQKLKTNISQNRIASVYYTVEKTVYNDTSLNYIMGVKP